MHATLRPIRTARKSQFEGTGLDERDPGQPTGPPARPLAVPSAAPRGSRLPDYAALAGAVRGLLRDGRLALGVRLPAERELAEALGVSRTTVTAAYRELRESRPPDQPARRGQLDRAARRVTGSPPRACGRPSDEPDLIDLGCAALAAPAAAGRGGGRGGRRTWPATPSAPATTRPA